MMNTLINRLTIYTLGTLALAMIGLIISIFSFGEYTMCEMVKDIAGIMIAISMTDCIYNLIEGIKEIQKGA